MFVKILEVVVVNIQAEIAGVDACEGCERSTFPDSVLIVDLLNAEEIRFEDAEDMIDSLHRRFRDAELATVIFWETS